jgi:phage shock protein A
LTEDIYVCTQDYLDSYARHFAVNLLRLASKDQVYNQAASANFAVQSLQASVQRVHTYIGGLEEKIADLERKKR